MDICGYIRRIRQPELEANNVPPFTATRALFIHSIIIMALRHPQGQTLLLTSPHILKSIIRQLCVKESELTDWFVHEKVEHGVTESVCFRKSIPSIQSEAVKMPLSPIVPSQSNILCIFRRFTAILCF
jgi:hypothetical protein